MVGIPTIESRLDDPSDSIVLNLKQLWQLIAPEMPTRVQSKLHDYQKRFLTFRIKADLPNSLPVM